MRAYELALIQQRSHELVISVGGYWPVLGAVARLLEEFSELLHAVAESDQDSAIDEATDIVVDHRTLLHQVNRNTLG